MALPETLNLDCNAGDDFSHVVDLDVLDASDYTIEAEVVSAITSEQVEQFTVTAAAAPNHVILSIAGGQTAVIARGSYLWRLVITSAESVRSTPYEGIFEVS